MSTTEVKKGQEWKNNSTTIRITDVYAESAQIGTVQADGSLARKRGILLKTLRSSYWLVKETP